MLLAMKPLRLALSSLIVLAALFCAAPVHAISPPRPLPDPNQAQMVDLYSHLQVLQSQVQMYIWLFGDTPYLQGESMAIQDALNVVSDEIGHPTAWNLWDVSNYVAEEELLSYGEWHATNDPMWQGLYNEYDSVLYWVQYEIQSATPPPY